MKVIEKVTRDGDIQFFEIIESRKELGAILKDILWDSLYSQYKTGAWTDDDSSLYIEYKNGDFAHYCIGSQVKRPNISNISKMQYNNPETTMIYGNIQIVQNDHYGDWDTDF